ncbi:MAG: flagellar assembly protein FliW [Candidatus Krumholzibacteriota bacterium]|nr:flagellar assembly protein FliW [Candidatus Krumholzibacteriota bacterium]
MKIKSSLFDEIEFDQKDIIVLEQGLIGMPDLKRFVVMDFADEALFHWLQSVEQPDIGFVVSEPTIFDEKYSLAIPVEVKEFLKIDREDDVVVMTIVSIKNQGETITGNLLGPIVVNATKRIGCQLVIETDEYSTTTPLRRVDNVEVTEESRVGCTA